MLDLIQPYLPYIVGYVAVTILWALFVEWFDRNKNPQPLNSAAYIIVVLAWPLTILLILFFAFTPTGDDNERP